MKISYAIPVCNEIKEIQRLIGFLLENKNKNDEIVVLYDTKNGTKEVELFTDQWRTAGTAQKVASYFGKGMRDCLQGKAAK